MENNQMIVSGIVDYIEKHLSEGGLSLETVAGAARYSKYHVHRIFHYITGFPIHIYIVRRRMTEAAKVLVTTDRPVLDIAMDAGYETQRSFGKAFWKLYGRSPAAFRKRKEFYPIQLKYEAEGDGKMEGNRILDIRTVDLGELVLIGFCRNTGNGFRGIGACWRKFQIRKHKIQGRRDLDFLVGLSDYSNFTLTEEGQQSFTCLAAAETERDAVVPAGMVKTILPAGTYVAFRFRGRNEDSMEAAADFIYRDWFPKSTCRFDENHLYDFVKYGEAVDEWGESQIEYWVPIVKEQ